MEDVVLGIENTQVTYRKKSPSQGARFTKKVESDGAERVPSVIILQVDSKKLSKENDINVSRSDSNVGQSKTR